MAVMTGIAGMMNVRPISWFMHDIELMDTSRAQGWLHYDCLLTQLNEFDCCDCLTLRSLGISPAVYRA